ncbi:MAG: hypothetical protein LBC47_10335 [Tannerella sp.]|jgi:hypothetical protein|nr:hypothetical protein [Tannerella sp.]
MKTKKLFKCKFEDLPTIGEFAVGSAKRDLADFSGFSLVFNPDTLDGIEMKIAVCREKVRSWVVVGELKSTTEKLNTVTRSLRVKLNALEGYVKLASGELDVNVADTGIPVVRNAISRGNTEGVIAGVTNVLAVANRNMKALEAKGMKSALLDEIAATTREINALNVRQNELESKRNRLTEENTEVFNDLWKALSPVFETGKALYRGVNEAKLKDYTVAQLVKRINAGKKKEKGNNG